MRAPKLLGVCFLLDIAPQRFRRRAASARHQVVEIGAGQVENDLALGNVGQQRNGSSLI
jgi:hypothetical protein